MAKSIELTKQLYNARIKILESKERELLNSLKPSAKKSMKELLDLTSESEQNKTLEQAIQQLEDLLDEDYILKHSGKVAEIQQEIAKKILNIDKELQVLGNEESIEGLKNLSEGNFNKIIAPISSDVSLVSNSDLNNWIVKIMKRIAYIKEQDKVKKFSGYLSNLKGEYLEQAVLKELRKYLPKDMLVQSGSIRAGNRQIGEDIFLVYLDNTKDTLQNILNDNGLRSKTGRITISVPIYEEIQSGAVGISIKAGSSPIKFYEGNLNIFFDEGKNDEDVFYYRQNVLMRSITGHKDNEKGAIMNRYITALRLDQAVGSNNLFLSTRNQLLTTMSKELAIIRDNGMLSMYYNNKYKASKKAKLGSNTIGSISGRILAPRF